MGCGIFGEGSQILTNQKREECLLAYDRLKFGTVLLTIPQTLKIFIYSDGICVVNQLSHFWMPPV